MVEEQQRAAYARGWSDELAGKPHAYQRSNEALFFYEMGRLAATNSTTTTGEGGTHANDPRNR